MSDQNDASNQQREANQDSSQVGPTHQQLGDLNSQPHVSQERVAQHFGQSPEAKRDNSNGTIAWATKINAFASVMIFLANVVFAFFAFEQWQLGLNTEQTQLRAYATLTLDKFIGPEVGKTMTGIIRLENAGNTPVYHGTLQVRFFFSNDNLPDHPLNDCEPWQSGMYPGLVFGKAFDWGVESKFAVNNDQMNELQAGRSKLISLARFCYSDVFKEVHYSDLCLQLFYKDGKLQNLYCGHYNDAT